MMKLVLTKQKIWHSVREVRDSLMKLERNLKHAIKLKNEQGMDSRTYYKYAKNSFPKIQEKLIKMAKRIGELSVSTYKKMMAEAAWCCKRR